MGMVDTSLAGVLQPELWPIGSKVFVQLLAPRCRGLSQKIHRTELHHRVLIDLHATAILTLPSFSIIRIFHAFLFRSKSRELNATTSLHSVASPYFLVTSQPLSPKLFIMSKEFTPAEVAKHKDADSMMLIIDGNVYDIASKFISFSPMDKGSFPKSVVNYSLVLLASAMMSSI